MKPPSPDRRPLILAVLSLVILAWSSWEYSIENARRNAQSAVSSTAPTALSSAPTRDEPSTAAAPTEPLVWVNTRSGIWHLPGTRWYGNTREGQYMTVEQARAAGYRAAMNE